MSDRERTRDFAILNVLVNYTGKFLSGDLVEEIYEKIKEEMHSGPTSWAFKSKEDDDE